MVDGGKEVFFGEEVGNEKVEVRLSDMMWMNDGGTTML